MIMFGVTKARLFEYMLSRMDEFEVCDSDIITDVFYNFGLRCTRSYLLSMVKKIRDAFNFVGF